MNKNAKNFEVFKNSLLTGSLSRKTKSITLSDPNFLQETTYLWQSTSLRVTAISTPPCGSVMLFELLPRGKKRISLIANIFFFPSFFLYSRVSEQKKKSRGKGLPPFSSLFSSSPGKGREREKKERKRQNAR